MWMFVWWPWSLHEKKSAWRYHDGAPSPANQGLLDAIRYFFHRVVQGLSSTLQESGPPGSTFPTPAFMVRWVQFVRNDHIVIGLTSLCSLRLNPFKSSPWRKLSCAVRNSVCKKTATLFSPINLFQVIFEALKYRSVRNLSVFRLQNHAGANLSLLFQYDSASLWWQVFFGFPLTQCFWPHLVPL